MTKQLVEKPVFITNTRQAVEGAFEKYGNEQKLSFNCESCGQLAIKKVVGFRIQNYLFLCTKCGRRLNTKNTFKQKYGVENPMFLDECKQRQRESFKNINWTKVVEKRQETCEKNYGVKNPSQSEVVKQQKMKTFEEHFGADNVFKTSYFDQKRKETNRKKYGVDFASQAQIVKDKQAQTNYERWGFKSTAQSPIVRQKLSKRVRIACENRTPEQWQIIRQKAVKQYLFQGEYFDSSWELALWIYAKDHNEEIVHEPCQFEYEFEGKKHRYYPDFEYKGNLVEVKGPQFFNEQGNLFNPFDRSLDDLLLAKWNFMKSINVNVYSTNEIQPILDYVKKTYTKDFLELFNTKLPFPYPSLTTTGDFDVIKYFHKSLYEGSYKGKLSPLKAWENKDYIRISALNRLHYVKSCKPLDVLRGFTLTQLAPKISIFKPKLAERLIKTYLKDCKTIVDPFSGFSGRLVGSMNCKKQYFGRDINMKHVEESNQIIRYKGYKDCEVKIEDLLRKTGVESFDCLFTCPPYGGKEHWNENNDEVEKSCDEWIDICLEKYKCKKYLFVVDKTEKYKDRVVEELEKKTLWRGRPELVILINRTEV